MFHACANDIAWLDSNFNLYLVTVFDTAEAAGVLGTRRQPSLSSLLAQHFGVITNKALQVRGAWLWALRSTCTHARTHRSLVRVRPRFLAAAYRPTDVCLYWLSIDGVVLGLGTCTGCHLTPAMVCYGALGAGRVPASTQGLFQPPPPPHNPPPPPPHAGVRLALPTLVL